MSGFNGMAFKGLQPQDLTDSINAGGYSHNAFYRGENLGTITSSNISAFVSEHGLSNGTYADIYPGDYF